MFRSSDNGNSWVQVNNGMTFNDIQSLAVSDAELFAGTGGSGIFHSFNRGNSWSQYSDGLTPTYALSLSVYNSYLFAGTMDGGVWRRPLSEMVNTVPIVPSRESSRETKFMQNLGGLIRPGARIEYAIKQQGLVNLSVYDTKGKKLATLVNSALIPGIHSAVFDSPGSPGGLYLFRLQSGGNSGTIRFVLEKYT